MGITGIIFALGFFTLLGLALMRHPRFGVYAYLAAFYVHPPSRWWGAALPDFRWSLLASVVTLIAVMRYPRNENQPNWLATTPARLLIFFTILVWIENLWALDPQEHMSMSVLMTKYMLMFYFIYRTSDSEENIRWFFLVHVAGSFYLGLLAYGQPVSGRLDGVGGPGIDDSNTLGMHLGTAIVCGAMLVLVDRGWRLFFSVVALALIANGVVLCGSRGAFLSIVCGGLILLFVKPKEYRKLFYGLAALGVIMFAIVASATFWARMGTLTAAVDDQQEMDNSAESRIVVLQAQWEMAKNYPFGTGHRGTVVLSRQYIPEQYLERLPDGTYGARSSHNTLMSALLEHGILGFTLILILILWCRRAVKQTYKSLSVSNPSMTAYLGGVAAALVVVMVAGFFADFIVVEVQFWMLAMLGSMHAMTKKNPAVFARAPTVVAEPIPARST